MSQGRRRGRPTWIPRPGQTFLYLYQTLIVIVIILPLIDLVLCEMRTPLRHT